MNTPTPQPPRPRGMSELAGVGLDPASRQLLEAAERTCGGPVHVRRRLLAEARDLLAQALLSRRFHVLHLDVSVDLRAIVDLIAPVPCRPDPNGPLKIIPLARVGLRYPTCAFTMPMPGTSFVEILAPPAVFHSNVRFGFPQVVCLGRTMPIGFPVREIMPLLYTAITLKTISLDEHDPQGVLNCAAVDFFLRNRHFVPLTHESFIRPGA